LTPNHKLKGAVHTTEDFLGYVLIPIRIRCHLVRDSSLQNTGKLEYSWGHRHMIIVMRLPVFVCPAGI
jgi:hypothetical protein